jgi:uncharacterized protein (DUF427 family)
MTDQRQTQTPQPGQESVWDYPRPPRVEPSPARIRVIFAGETVADTQRAMRVLETSHPPVYYIPQGDIRMELITPTQRHTFCEFKGTASYWTLRVGERSVENVAWSYESPTAGFEVIRGYLAFYPGRVDACFVDEEQVTAQEGDFYGGWITSAIVGPFKGGKGTQGW